MADEVIAGYRDGRDAHEGDKAVLSAVMSWHKTAHAHGEELQDNDFIALIQELARRIAER